MSNLANRIAMLEKDMASKSGLSERWHSIIQRIGQTQEDAIAEYEAEHGFVGRNDHTIIRRIVAPNPEAFK